MNQWKEDINTFLRLANEFNVRMIMIGGGAVNFHGYQRHSADVDFWIDMDPENLQKLISIFRQMGFKMDDFPEKVKSREQNISVKFSPEELTLELITQFSIGKSFDEAFADAEIACIDDHPVFRWRVLALEDLIESKLRASRPKDLLDIKEIRRINGLDTNSN